MTAAEYEPTVSIARAVAIVRAHGRDVVDVGVLAELDSRLHSLGEQLHREREAHAAELREYRTAHLRLATLAQHTEDAPVGELVALLAAKIAALADAADGVVLHAECRACARVAAVFDGVTRGLRFRVAELTADAWELTMAEYAEQAAVGEAEARHELSDALIEIERVNTERAKQASALSAIASMLPELPPDADATTIAMHAAEAIRDGRRWTARKDVLERRGAMHRRVEAGEFDTREPG